MVRKLAILVAALSVGACVSSVAFAPRSELISSERVSDKSYRLGQVSEAFVGNPIIKVRDYKQEIIAGDVVTINKDFSLNGFLFNKDFTKGETYKYGGTANLNDQEMEFFWVDGFRGILFNRDGEVQKKILSSSGGTTVYVAYTYENDGGAGAVSRETIQATTNTPDGQNFEIIYSGISDDTIRLQYREFTDDNMARQAFFQDLTYPISAKQIRFKHIVLDVISVGSDRIEFRVVSDTN